MRHAAEVEPMPFINVVEAILVTFQIAILMWAAIAGVVTA